MNTSRRKFIKTGSMAVASGSLLAGMPFIRVSGNGSNVPPSDKVNIGLIGCKGMGFANLKSMLKIPEAACIALCDVDKNVMEKRAAEVEELSGKKPRQYGDYRKLLENKDIDAVIIGTPDHWHCLPFVEACQAEKDIYCEKPLANSIEECNIMMEAAEKYERVVQVGMWQRSAKHFQDAVDFVHSGKLGRVRMVKVWANMGWLKSIPVVPNEPAPEGVDYDMWLGPAPKRPFNQNRFHFTWRWFWDYAGGLMTDWGVHLLDIALWGMKATAPKSVMSAGGKMAYPEDAQETPDTLSAIYEFEDHILQWDHAVAIDSCYFFNRDHGIAFVGNNGTLIVDRRGWEIVPEVRGRGDDKKYLVEPEPKHERVGSPLDNHTRNFLDCMKSREKTNTTVETGGHTAKIAHLGNIAYLTGRKVYWDNARGRFTDDKEANGFLVPSYRSPWELPKL